MTDPLRMTPAGPRRTAAPRPFLNRPHLLASRERREPGRPKLWVWTQDCRPELGVVACTKSEARAALQPHFGGALRGVRVRRLRLAEGAERPGLIHLV